MKTLESRNWRFARSGVVPVVDGTRIIGETTRSIVDDLSTCVGCGLCLPHCPTFRITSEEGHSPRGRISLIRDVVTSASVGARDIEPFLDTCIQCRGCEPACPSGVPYGRILSTYRGRPDTARQRVSMTVAILLAMLDRPRVLALASRVLFFVTSRPLLRRCLPGSLRQSQIPRPRGSQVRRSVEDPDVWLFAGCVMDSWYASAHQATCDIIEHSGSSVATPTPAGGCCGALHLHAGRHRRARVLARRTMRSMPGTAPIVVDSAGCGAHLKEYGDILGSEAARSFARRVLDVHEWMAPILPRLLEESPHRGPDDRRPVVVQEPCHLRHVQGVSVADVLELCLPVVRLNDDGLCCGAGGSYSLSHPVLARSLKDRKTAEILRVDPTGSSLVVTANPGCLLHLASNGHPMRFSVEVVAERLGLGSPGQADR